ncbi:MAG: DUF484 family protein [Gammaproteobacteria bacterium]|nr:DUF484 family protein [Gammaproteobacteria bacterium]
MKENDQTASQSEMSVASEQATHDYLAEHPRFFQRHPELLDRLRIPHTERGAVSLIEKQVDVLRSRNRSLERQLKSLIQTARDNEKASERLHQMTLRLTDAASLDDVLATAQDGLREAFRLEASVIRLMVTEDQAGTPELVSASDPIMQKLSERLRGGRVRCGDSLEEPVAKFLFGERSAEVRSTALIPFGGKPLRGVLVLGSDDAARFRPEIGTVYLSRLGELVGAALERFSP